MGWARSAQASFAFGILGSGAARLPIGMGQTCGKKLEACNAPCGTKAGAQHSLTGNGLRWYGDEAKLHLLNPRCWSILTNFGDFSVLRPRDTQATTPRYPNTSFYSEWSWRIMTVLRTFEGARGDMARDPTNDLFDPQAFLAKVGAGKTISTYRKDQIIFSQGEVADTIFYIHKGSVKIVVLSDQGKEAVVGILEAGHFFGEGCMNGHSLRIATATATEESLITAITKPAMIAIMHDEPKFSELFVAYLLTRNSRVEDDLIDQLFNSSEKRLAREIRQGRQPNTHQPRYQSGNLGRDDRHDTIPRKFLPKQIPQIGLNQLQRKNPGSQFPVGCSPA
jgi:CRP-like cAMP-binding protein